MGGTEVGGSAVAVGGIGVGGTGVAVEVAGVSVGSVAAASDASTESARASVASASAVPLTTRGARVAVGVGVGSTRDCGGAGVPLVMAEAAFVASGVGSSEANSASPDAPPLIPRATNAPPRTRAPTMTRVTTVRLGFVGGLLALHTRRATEGPEPAIHAANVGLNWSGPHSVEALFDCRRKQHLAVWMANRSD